MPQPPTHQARRFIDLSNAHAKLPDRWTEHYVDCDKRHFCSGFANLISYSHEKNRTAHFPQRRQLESQFGTRGEVA